MHLIRLATICIALVFSSLAWSTIEGELVRFTVKLESGSYPKSNLDDAKEVVTNELFSNDSNIKYSVRLSLEHISSDCNWASFDKELTSRYLVKARLKRLRPDKKLIRDDEFYVLGSSLNVAFGYCDDDEASTEALGYAAAYWPLLVNKDRGEDVQADIDSLITDMQAGPSHGLGSLAFKGLIKTLEGAVVVGETSAKVASELGEVATEIGGAIADNPDMVMGAARGYNTGYSSNNQADPAMEIFNQTQRNLNATSNKAITELNHQNHLNKRQATKTNVAKYSNTLNNINKSNSPQKSSEGHRSSFKEPTSTLALDSRQQERDERQIQKRDLSFYPITSHENQVDCIEYKGTWVKSVQACFDRDSLMRKSCKAVINKGVSTDVGLGLDKPGSCLVYVGLVGEGTIKTAKYDRYEARDAYSSRVLIDFSSVEWKKVIPKTNKFTSGASVGR